jgi:CheY-like chemotaxis protein
MPAATPLPPAVLLVDDEPDARQLVVSILLMYCPADTILSASDGRHALQYLDTCAIRLLITGHPMRNLTGLELIDIVKARYPDTQIILIGDAGDQQIERCAHEHGADHVLTKPFRVPDLRGVLEQVLAPARNEHVVGYS